MKPSCPLRPFLLQAREKEGGTFQLIQEERFLGALFGRLPPPIDATQDG